MQWWADYLDKVAEAHLGTPKLVACDRPCGAVEGSCC